MSSIVLDDHVMSHLRERHPRYQETAYVFLLSALHFVLQRLGEPRHVSGREVAEGVRDLAIARFGPMAGTVLEHWGIRSTLDVGQIVFALVDCGILLKQDDDALHDFHDVFDFEEVFERTYPWGASVGGG